MLAGAFVTDYWIYLMFRFVTCTSIVLCWIACHNFQLEWFSKTNRLTANVISQVVGHGVGVVLPIIAWFNRDYKWMHIWAAAIGALALPTYFLIPESPRWLACNNRREEAEHKVMVG